MKTLLIVSLLVLEALAVKIAHAATPAAPGTFSQEAAKQAEIYKSAGQNTPEGYVVDRSLLSYVFALPAEFKHSLTNLAAHDRWLDIGAGEGRAVLDYSTSQYDVMLQGPKKGSGKAQGVALSIEDRRTARWLEAAASLGEQRMQYLFGRRLREYSLAELGQFQLMTDVIGAFSYTRYLSVFMEKALGFLGVTGSFYTVLQDVHAESGENRPYYPNAPFLTEIVNSEGAEVKVCSWLKSISCVDVTCELKPNWTPPVEVYRIRKVCSDVSVPELAIIHFEAGTPPERRFRLQNASAQPLEPAKTKQ
jgi:hypothetical protein